MRNWKRQQHVIIFPITCCVGSCEHVPDVGAIYELIPDPADSPWVDILLEKQRGSLVCGQRVVVCPVVGAAHELILRDSVISWKTRGDYYLFY